MKCIYKQDSGGDWYPECHPEKSFGGTLWRSPTDIGRYYCPFCGGHIDPVFDEAYKPRENE